MKKIGLFIFMALFLAGFTYAQQASPIYEVQGKYSLSAGFNPASFFDSDAEATFNMPNIALRIYQPNGTAYRLGFNLQFSSEKEYEGSNEDTYYKDSYTRISIAPGLQKFFNPIERIRPFYGFEVPLIYQSEKYSTINYEGKGGFFGFGVNAVIGVNYLIKGGFYISTEFTPGLLFISEFDDKTDGMVNQKGGTYISFGLDSYSGLKLGYRF